MANQVASHATRAEHPKYRGGARALRLRITPRVGLADLARLDRIQPRCALEYHFIIRRRDTLTKVSREWDDLGLRRRRQKNAYRECSRQAV